MNEEQLTAKYSEELQKITNEYEANILLIERFAKTVNELIDGIANKNQFTYIIQKRVKEPLKLKNKLVRAKKQNKTLIEWLVDGGNENIKSFRDVEDLAGVRIIFIIESELNRFLELIQREFPDCVQIHQVNKNGYRAIHIVFGFDKQRTCLPEYKDFNSLKCEIQLRTMLHHAWSEISHKIFYKPNQLYTTHTRNQPKDLIKEKLQSIKENFIDKADFELNLLYRFYRRVEEGSSIFEISRLRKIPTSDSNNYIFNELSYLVEALSSYRYQLPPDIDIFALIHEILAKVESNKVVDEDTRYLRRPGKTRDDIKIKLIELLKIIRFLDLNKTIELLIDFQSLSSTQVNESIKKAFQEISKYDYHTIKQVGYLPQLSLLDFLRKRNLDIELATLIAKEILDPAFEGTEMTDERTISWMFGPLPVTDELKTIRKQAIQILLERFEMVEGWAKKKIVIRTLQQATYLPDRGELKEDMKEMVAVDINMLIGAYESILFSSSHKLKADLPLVREIDLQLISIDKRIETNKEIVKKLKDKIRGNKLYSIYRLLASSRLHYRESGDWDRAEEIRKKKIDGLFNKITAEKVEYFEDIFNKIASSYDKNERWEWQEFSSLIQRVAFEKPEVAESLLDLSIQNQTKLVDNFLLDFLMGFRKANNFRLWTKFAKTIIKSNKAEILPAVFYSFWSVDKTNLAKSVRYDDILLLEEAVKSEADFKIYRINTTNDFQIHNSLINALVSVYGKDPKKMEELIGAEIEYHPSLSGLFIETIDTGLIREEITIKGWKQETINLIIGHFVKSESITHEGHNVLLALPETLIMELFEKRIQHKLKLSKSKKANSRLEYDAIPSHLEKNLIDKISNSPDFKTWAGKLISKMNSRRPFYNMLLAELFQKIGGGKLKELEDELLNGTENDLFRLTELLWSFNPPSIEYCFEIVKRTEDENILSKIASRIYATGIVSGEYGIYDSYKSKKETIIRITKVNKGNDRVRNFGERIIKSLDSSMLAEKKRVEEDTAFRKLQFEG